MARPAKPKLDPLLAALIEKLPPGGAEWPRAKRAAWLDNIARAFDSVYEGEAASVAAARAEPQILDLNRAYVEVPPARPGHITHIEGPLGGSALGATRTVQALGDDGRMHAATVPVSPARPPHDFYIDDNGFARRSFGGDRVMPHQVTSAIFDARGESGDPGAIVWADDSRGVRGLRLDISAG